MSCRLIRITAPHFCAGADIGENSEVVFSAPIIKWMKGRKLWWIKKYCESKGWMIGEI